MRKMRFEFLVDYYPMLLKGTGVTIALALITVFFGTLIGILVSLTKFNAKGMLGKVLSKLAGLGCHSYCIHVIHRLDGFQLSF